MLGNKIALLGDKVALSGEELGVVKDEEVKGVKRVMDKDKLIADIVVG